MAITKKPCIHAELIILLFSLFVSASSQTTGPGPKKPNVVFILVDNTGWGDFSVYGGTTATPLIDKLASEGIRFNNCTSYPLFNDMVKEVLARQRVPELLDQPPQILEDGRESPPDQLALDMKERPIVDGEYLIPKTIEFIQRQAAAKKPLFVDLGYSEMHTPSVCNPEFVNKSPSRGGIYSDCIAEMDYRIGQVLGCNQASGASRITPLSCSVATTQPTVSAELPALAAGRTGPGAEISSYTTLRALGGIDGDESRAR